MNRRNLIVAVAMAACFAAVGAHAQTPAQEVVIGVTLSSTGPAASLGIPERQVIALLPKTLGGRSVRYVVLDDATDPSAASRNARKLVDEEKVDAIIGSSTVPTSLAVAAVAAESKTPAIGLAPFVAKTDLLSWSFSLPQSVGVMAAALLEDMRARGVKTLGFVGFNDSYGEAWLKDLQGRVETYGVSLVAAERFARTDQAVAGQTLKMLAAKPDAVIVVGSGTPSVLPMTSLRERSYKGTIYQTHGAANNDVLRIAGKSAEGAIFPAGMLLVAEQLPDDNPSKAAALSFVQLYEGKYGARTRDLFAAYAYDAYLLLDKAVAGVAKSAKPGTPQFRQSLRDAIEGARDVPGSHGIISVNVDDHSAYDARGRVVVTVKGGNWTLVK